MFGSVSLFHHDGPAHSSNCVYWECVFYSTETNLWVGLIESSSAYERIDAILAYAKVGIHLTRLCKKKQKTNTHQQLYIQSQNQGWW